MKKVLLIDSSKNFIDDINRNLLINARDDMQITIIENINAVENYITSQNFDVVVLYAGFVESRDWQFGIPVRSYARKVAEIEISEKNNIKCYGLVNKSVTLIKDIAEDKLEPVRAESERPTNVLTSEDMPENLKEWNSREIGSELKKNKKTKEIPSYGETETTEVSEMPLQETANPPSTRVQREVIDIDPNAYQQMSTQYNSPYGVNSDVYGSQQSFQPYQQQSFQPYQTQSYQNPYQQAYEQPQGQQMPVPYQAQPMYSYTPSFQGQQPLFVDQFGRAVYEMIPMRQQMNYPNPYQQQQFYQQEAESQSPQYNQQYPQQYPQQGGQYPYNQQSSCNQQNMQVYKDQQAVMQNYHSQQTTQQSGYYQGQAQKSNQTANNPVQTSQPVQQKKPSVQMKETKKVSDGFDDLNAELDAYLAQEEQKDQMNAAQNMQVKANDRFKDNQQKAVDEAKVLAEQQFNKDIGNVEKKAKCITIYSAKGGVGKTTISCELASFLALTSHARGKYKVCIADFNIDFGDVMNTLDFDGKGANMTTWAEDIKMRIARGEDINDINYSWDEIQIWLQKKNESGLYGLLAPVSNIDSMNISENEIKVMINNLVRNCGFDFVICDTGNNTRDSSFIALENADIAGLVITQDVNTVSCNNSFLQTAKRVGYDMSKIKLIINLVRPTKIVGISPEDLKGAFKDENNVKYNFEILGNIKQNNEVVNCGNRGEPVVYNSSHEFTKSIGEMVGKITGQERVLSAPKKENVFGRIFKKPN